MIITFEVKVFYVFLLQIYKPIIPFKILLLFCIYLIIKMFFISLGDALQKCNLALFKNFFCPAEKLFRFFIKEKEATSKKGILESLLQLFFKNKEKFFPSCHDYDHKLAKRFFQIRLHLHAREISNIKRMEYHGSENSSKSVKMRVMVRNQHVSKKKGKVCDPFLIIA